LRVVYFDPSWFRMAELIQSGIATVERWIGPITGWLGDYLLQNTQKYAYPKLD
jgi:hypothetical protein